MWGYYKNVLWFVDINVENIDKIWLDFIRFSVIEMILLDMELIDIFWIINYVKGFIYISFVCFVYCREELFLIWIKILLNNWFEENIIVLVR